MTHRGYHVLAHAEARNGILTPASGSVAGLILGRYDSVYRFLEPPVAERECLVTGELWAVALFKQWSAPHATLLLDEVSSLNVANEPCYGQGTLRRIEERPVSVEHRPPPQAAHLALKSNAV